MIHTEAATVLSVQYITSSHTRHHPLHIFRVLLLDNNASSNLHTTGTMATATAATRARSGGGGGQGIMPAFVAILDDETRPLRQLLSAAAAEARAPAPTTMQNLASQTSSSSQSIVDIFHSVQDSVNLCKRVTQIAFNSLSDEDALCDYLTCAAAQDPGFSTAATTVHNLAQSNDAAQLRRVLPALASVFIPILEPVSATFSSCVDGECDEDGGESSRLPRVLNPLRIRVMYLNNTVQRSNDKTLTLSPEQQQGGTETAAKYKCQNRTTRKRVEAELNAAGLNYPRTNLSATSVSQQVRLEQEVARLWEIRNDLLLGRT